MLHSDKQGIKQDFGTNDTGDWYKQIIQAFKLTPYKNTKRKKKREAET